MWRSPASRTKVPGGSSTGSPTGRAARSCTVAPRRAAALFASSRETPTGRCSRSRLETGKAHGRQPEHRQPQRVGRSHAPDRYQLEAGHRGDRERRLRGQAPAGGRPRAAHRPQRGSQCRPGRAQDAPADAQGQRRRAAQPAGAPGCGRERVRDQAGVPGGGSLAADELVGVASRRAAPGQLRPRGRPPRHGPQADRAAARRRGQTLAEAWNGGAAFAGSLEIGLAGGTAATVAVDGSMSADDLRAAINAVSAQSGVAASILSVSASERRLVLSAAETGRAIEFADAGGDAVTAPGPRGRCRRRRPR